jgi:hypothetical protein
MDLVQELQFDINFEEILKITKKIDRSYPMFKAMGGGSLQHRSSVPGPWNLYDGLSSLGEYPEKTTETDFKELNQDFKDTEFEKIINHFKLYRTRLMLLENRSNYSIHVDKGWRLHLPIITNKDCRFYYSKFEKEFHLEAGKFYKVYVGTPHTFFNSSNTFRIHLVATIF